ncbi:MAG: hypothetical protein ACREGB_04395 [Candidatus Saccharimonadales bacterium]
MQFHVEEDTLTITLEGGEQLWALKRKLTVPRSSITGLQWHDTLVLPRREVGFRVGTAIPGGLWAGRYFAPGRRNFLYVQRTRGLFSDITLSHVLTFQLVDQPFQQLFLTVDNPDMAEKLVAWWSGKA